MAEKSQTKAAAAMADDKKRAIETAMQQIERTYGKGSIMRFGDNTVSNVEAISTGSLALDLALGIGGLPKGRIIEIYGPESSGKTTLALHVLAQAQKAGGEVAFIDAEHALDITYARALGVKVEDMLVSQPDTGEQALEITEALVRSGAIDVIVVDSLAALAVPVRIVQSNDFIRSGLDALTTADDAFETVGSFLGEGIGSARGLSSVSENTFLSALDGSGLYFAFACDLPCRGELLPDGRTLCGNCLATAVTDPAEAEKLCREVEREVAGLLGSPGCGRTGFVLCDLATLNRGREIVPGGKYELGRCNYEYRTRTYPGRKPEIVSERCTILILDTLPRDQFIEVAAHEAAHDWLNHHGRSLPPSWSEGFPEYVASLVNLRHGNGSRNLRMEKNEDPVYGAGFREVKAYADRHGLRKLLEYVRRTR